MRNNHMRLTAILIGLAGLGGAQETRPTMNARDMFYSAGDMMGAKKSEAAPAKPTHSRQTVPRGPGATKPAAPVIEIPSVKDAEVHFQTVSSPAELPLGLRYSILKKTGDGGLVEVKPDSVFHSGDSIRVSAMGNQKGYLYIISRGSSGTWTPFSRPRW